MRPPLLVILAAGASERLGSCKALVDIAGASPLERLLRAGEGLGCRAPLVITGPDHDRIRAATPAGVEVLENPDWAAGRTGSVQLAQRARPGRALCLAPVDVPRVPRAVFVELARAWERAGDPPLGWLAPRTDDGRYGHPVVLGAELLARGASLAPDTPLRTLREQAEPLLGVPVSGREILEDLDTPSDLERIRRRSRSPGE